MADSDNAPARRSEDELEELREAVLEDWIVVTTRSSTAVAAMQQTLSWRITRPLRLVRRFGKVSEDIGLANAVNLAAVSVARRVGRRG